MILHSQTPRDAVAYNIVEKGVHYALSDHFALHEFQSRDGSFALLVHPRLVYGLELLRRATGAPVHINRGYSTHAHNDTIPGAADESRHLWGMAADIVSEVWSARRVQEWAITAQFGGIGFYGSFTHVDVQGKGRRWGPTMKQVLS